MFKFGVLGFLLGECEGWVKDLMEPKNDIERLTKKEYHLSFFIAVCNKGKHLLQAKVYS